MKAHLMEKISLTPVGIVSSPIKEVFLKAGQSDLELDERKMHIKKNRKIVKETVSEIIVFDEWGGLLDGIDEFSHVMILYWPHLLENKRRSLKKVHPMGRKDLPLTGIFATRSPARPNPVLVSVVRVLERDKNVLRVMGFEAVDGSPVLDIKPHIEAYDTREEPRVSPWMAQIQREFAEES
jgi:tRNA-Thr(GGU) m(6)t(6)A37 methyltransferase TsaA